MSDTTVRSFLGNLRFGKATAVASLGDNDSLSKVNRKESSCDLGKAHPDLELLKVSSISRLYH